MSAVPKHLSIAAPADFNEADWIRLADAAPLLGKSPTHLTRVCKTQWYPRALAVQIDGRWRVHRSVDVRLSREQQAQQIDASALETFRGFPAAKQREAMARRDCVLELRRLRSESDVDGTLASRVLTLVSVLREKFPDIRISRSSLYTWDAIYSVPADLVALIDKRGGDRRSTGDPAAWAYFRGIYLDERQPSLAGCWQRTREHAETTGLRWCSVHSCRRQLDERIPLEIQVRHRDPRRWRSEFATYIEQDTERFGAGECWVGDHRPLDVIVRYQGKLMRPVITIWLDWRTRKVVGHAFGATPNTSSILAALRMGITDETNGGSPPLVWMDNGKDFESFALIGATKTERKRGIMRRMEFNESQFKGVFGLLGIEPHFAIKFCPQGKARCERWFATMGSHFDKSFATYCGKDTTRKPEDLMKRLRETPHQVPTFEHVAARLDEFVRGYNANADHSMDDLVDDGTRLSPAEALLRWRTERIIMADPAALDLCLLQHHKPVTMGRNGIGIAIAGQTIRYGQWEDALRPYKGTGKELFVAYDPQNINELQVFDDRWAFVCIAYRNQTGGRHDDPVTRDHVAELARRKTAYNKSMKLLKGNRELEYVSNEEMLSRIASEPRTPKEPSAPDVLRVIQTPLDQASNAVQNERARLAAGAESMDVDDSLDISKIDWNAGMVPEDEDMDDLDLSMFEPASLDDISDNSTSILDELP